MAKRVVTRESALRSAKALLAEHFDLAVIVMPDSTSIRDYNRVEYVSCRQSTGDALLRDAIKNGETKRQAERTDKEEE